MALEEQRGATPTPTPSHPLASLLGPGPKEVAAGPCKGQKGARESERAEQCGRCLKGWILKDLEGCPKESSDSCFRKIVF